jgi:hypothetical protein
MKRILLELTNQLKQAVWGKGQEVKGFNSDMYRKNPCGAWIAWDKYGQDNIFGCRIV